MFTDYTELTSCPLTMLIILILNVKIVWKVKTNLIKILPRIVNAFSFLFFFFNRFLCFILLFFSLACCFWCFVCIMIFNNFYTFCILQNENYLFVFFIISKRKLDRISVNIHQNEIIFYILVLTSFLKWFQFKF